MQSTIEDILKKDGLSLKILEELSYHSEMKMILRRY